LYDLGLANWANPILAKFESNSPEHDSTLSDVDLT